MKLYSCRLILARGADPLKNRTYVEKLDARNHPTLAPLLGINAWLLLLVRFRRHKPHHLPLNQLANQCRPISLLQEMVRVHESGKSRFPFCRATIQRRGISYRLMVSTPTSSTVCQRGNHSKINMCVSSTDPPHDYLPTL